MISDDEYTAIIIKSLPPSYADYLSYITGTILALKMKVGSSQLCSQLEQEYIRRKSTIPTNAQPRAKDAAYQADAGPSCCRKKNPRGGKWLNATGAGQTESKKELHCWNCEGIGHQKTKCPSPAHEKSGRGDGTSKMTEAANTLDDHEVAGS
jgi:hypothetical protein